MVSIPRLKDVNLEENVNRTIYIRALLNKAELKPTRNGSGHYMNTILCDNNIKVSAKMWNANDKSLEKFVVGKVYVAQVSVDTWEGKPSLVLKSAEVSDESPVDYVESIDNAEMYIQLIKNSREKITPGSVYRRIVDELVTDEVISKMVTHPAASGQHHNIIGGLVMHTATMAQGGYFLAQVYHLNVDLVLSAILLHDLQKLNELSCSLTTGEIKYTVPGSLQGHITMMAVTLSKVADKLGIPEDDEELLMLKHCILAHHGRLEWGSPVEPVIREALLVHYMDGLDAEMYKMNKAMEHMEPGTTLYEHGRVFYNPAHK